MKCQFLLWIVIKKKKLLKTTVLIQHLIFRCRDRQRKSDATEIVICCRSRQRKPTSRFSVHGITMTVLIHICFDWFRHIQDDDRTGTGWFQVPYRSLDFLIDANSAIHQFQLPFKKKTKLILCLSSKIYIMTSSVIHVDCGNRVNLITYYKTSDIFYLH